MFTPESWPKPQASVAEDSAHAAARIHRGERRTSGSHAAAHSSSHLVNSSTATTSTAIHAAVNAQRPTSPAPLVVSTTATSDSISPPAIPTASATAGTIVRLASPTATSACVARHAAMVSTQATHGATSTAA
jgi:hypothetical protein